MKERYNCITCSKECDYKLKNKIKIKNNGIDYFYNWRDTISPSMVLDESPNNIKFWIKKGYTKELARERVSQYNRSVSPLCKEYYQKYTDITDESIIDSLISNEQKRRSKRNIEYWTSRGKTINEDEKLVSIWQDKTSLLSFTEKYGDILGKKKYDNFVQKIKDTTVFDINVLMNNGFSKSEATQKLVDIQLAAGNARCSSGRFGIFEKSLIPILEHLKIEYVNKKAIKIDDRYFGSNKDYIQLDYFLPELNFNIEMDGRYWHSKRRQAKEDKHRDNFLNLIGIKVLRVDEYLWNNMKKHERINYIGEKLCVFVK